MSVVLDTPNKIAQYRAKALLSMLNLEIKGMPRSRGRSAYSLVKEQYNFKGSKKKVYQQFKELLERYDNEV